MPLKDRTKVPYLTLVDSGKTSGNAVFSAVTGGTGGGDDGGPAPPQEQDPGMNLAVIEKDLDWVKKIGWVFIGGFVTVVGLFFTFVYLPLQDLRTSVAVMANDQSTIKSDVSEIKSDIKILVSRNVAPPATEPKK